MPQKTIIEKLRCPRCNADAQIRVIELDRILQLYLVCPMCRLKQYKGTTSRRAIRLEKQIQKYMELLDNKEKIEEKYKILDRIQLLQEKLTKERLGLRS
jgi:excinuclease UvrABC ATPase subunit